MNKSLEWNLDSLIQGKNNSIKSRKLIINNACKELLSLKGSISKSINNFKKYLSYIEIISEHKSILGCYFYNKLSENVGNTESQKNIQNFEQYASNIDVELSFINNEIKNNIDTILTYIDSDDTLSHLKFSYNLVKRNLKHKISDESEKIISHLINSHGASSDVFSKLTNADFTFENIKDSKGHDHKLTQGTAALYLRNQDITLRKNAYLSFWKTYYSHKNSLSSTYYHNLLLSKAYANIYKYNDSLEMYLHGDNVDRKFYDFVLENVKGNSNLIIKWKNILKKITKVNNPNPWDWNGPLFKLSDKEYKMSESKSIINEALAVLGKNYLNKINYIFDNKLIDWLPKDGKRSGAYSYGVWNADPYILLNWNSKYVDLSTLIHELGHSVHTMYSNENQKYENHNYPIFLAEVASITNELLLVMHLLKKEDDLEIKKMLLENIIKEFIATVWRQSQFAEFEKIVHDRVDQGESLNYDDFSNIASSLTDKYYPKTETETYKDKYDGIWSIYIPHFYSDFYVYKYTTGAICAFAFVHKIMEGNYDINKYLNFLKSGGSNWPLDILKEAGVDLRKKETFDHAFKMFENLLDNLETLI